MAKTGLLNTGFSPQNVPPYPATFFWHYAYWLLVFVFIIMPTAYPVTTLPHCTIGRPLCQGKSAVGAGAK